jgi:hypothetical protein
VREGERVCEKEREIVREKERERDRERKREREVILLRPLESDWVCALGMSNCWYLQCTQIFYVLEDIPKAI